MYWNTNKLGPRRETYTFWIFLHLIDGLHPSVDFLVYDTILSVHCAILVPRVFVVSLAQSTNMFFFNVEFASEEKPKEKKDAQHAEPSITYTLTIL